MYEPTLDERKMIYKARRGLKELDYYIDYYVKHYYLGADKAEKAAFADLLDYEDPDLLLYFLGQETPDKTAVAVLIDKMRKLRHATP